MSRNIVPRIGKGADLGTAEKNWNKLFADAVVLRGKDLQALLDGKTNLDTLMAKGDLYVATGAGAVTRLPKGADGYVLKSNAAVPEGLMWGPAGARQELTNNITVTVGDGGDFPTINAALESVVALYYPKYIANNKCPRVIINLLPGFVMSEQVVVKSLDLSWIKITGVDEETIINRSALINWFGNGIPAFTVIEGGFLPIINQLFNMDSSGDAEYKTGIMVYENSRAIVSYGCGIKNAGHSGIFAGRSSIISIFGANCSNAGFSGIYANEGSVVNANMVKIMNCYNGIYAERGARINAYKANITGAGRIGIQAVEGSIINASHANISGATNRGILAQLGSIVNADNADASSAGYCGMEVYCGSIINANNATGTLNQAVNTITSNGIIFQ